MKFFSVLPLLLTSGCALAYGAFGFPPTEKSTHCGQQNGIEVWVDGVTTRSTLAMSCPEALATVKQAHDVGATRGMWPKDQKWDYRLEFINGWNVGAIGSLDSGNAAGYTLTFWAHVSAVAYGSDGPESFVTSEPSNACVILMHEMIHMTEGGNAGHCHWNSRYATKFKGLKNEGAQSWLDLCELPVDTGSSG